MEKTGQVVIRGKLPEDDNFIAVTWLKGLRYGNDWFNAIEHDAYYKNYNQIINDILKKPETQVRVACLKDEQDVILGYSVSSSPELLHWVFVKPVWRKFGIAKLLVDPSLKTVTHLTKLGASLLPSAVSFNPFAT